MDFVFCFYWSKAILQKEFSLVPQLKIQKQNICRVVAFLYLDRHFQPKLLALPWNDVFMHHDENSQRVILTFNASFLLFPFMPPTGVGG